MGGLTLVRRNRSVRARISLRGFRKVRILATKSFDRVEPVELVVFGSSCLSFLIAGKRVGLDDFWRQGMNDDVEALAGFRRHKITREQIVLRFADLELMLATPISFPQPLFANHVWSIE